MSRPDGMKTYDYLAQELEKIGLREMAEAAKKAYYHDYLSPLEMPSLQLLYDLAAAAMVAKSVNNTELADKILMLRSRHMQGEFDASSEESDDWAKSPAGQEAFNELLKDFKKN